MERGSVIEGEGTNDAIVQARRPRGRSDHAERMERCGSPLAPIAGTQPSYP